ncbi:SH3 domain-containing protein [Alkalinema sp. FACHB-956]|uniref:SH3 domain-containing protein n=1 Tax=Alkalinema sp. FACHB-956 TaxID=2692768 RepID=UPI00168733AB|nr:SH3 domain-containing protein [Alkalinema sp. FACHB-956]MBD2326447.1 SH3 domain-containing protein [Alkalinema sp. FACHB-956]
MVNALPGMTRPATIDSEGWGAMVRSGPSLKMRELGSLAHGAPVEVLKVTTTNDSDSGLYWYYVQSTGRSRAEGWVSGSLVRFKSSNQTYGTLAGSSNDVINIRSAPSLKGNVVHTGVVGDLVTVGRSSRDAGYRWYHITYPNGSKGWVREDLISVWPQGCIITCPEH